MKQTTIIIEKSRYADGFLHGVRQTVEFRKQEFFNVLPLDLNVSNANLRQKLIDLTNKGWKVIVLHCSPDLMLRVVTVALSTRLYNSGYAWFLSEMAFSRDKALIAHLPEGLLAIDSFWLGGISQVMAKALEHIVSASTCLLESQSPDSYKQVPYKVCDDGNSHITWGNYQPLEYNLTNGENTNVNLRAITDFTYEFTRCQRMLLTFCDEDPALNSNETEKNSYDNNTYNGHVKETNTDVSPDVPVRNTGPAFHLLNTVNDGGSGDRIWATVGYITARGERDLKTVLWPGHNIYGPSSNAVKTYRVVTRAAEPFVFISSQVSRKEDCFIEVPCLRVDNSSQALLTTVVDDFQSDMEYVEQLYSIHCCKGLSLEILDSLAIDLNFRYVIYFVNDTNYGTPVKDVWTGMVGDIITGAADIVAGAFSVTSERMNVMDFTEPFYQNKFSLVTAQGDSYVSIWAFLNPFSRQVWLCIMLSSIVAGVATAFLEWHSPFGLNPRGRKRTKNYGLGSGLLMVMVLLTGHTINIKAPKSWPGKVIQNVWAGLAIFIMTSYTANLAAYLAGQSAVTTVASVYDPELLTKRVAIIPSSAVESFLEKINPKLSKRAQLNPMATTSSAINLLRDQTIDIYLDDIPLLEFVLAKNDKDCKVRFAGPGKGFGSDGYAFGLARQSWLQIPMSNQILWYTESGYIQELARKYLSRPQCEHFLAGSANPYGLEHTGGLFIILVSAMCVSLLFHVLEHLAYRYLVPWLRKQPIGSFWKTENLAFISQRVFRVVRSEKLFSQKKAAREMIKIVKQRDFTRLIQKHELQKRRVQTQKRVKTKAEIFQEITSNIISYHRQQQTPSENADSSDAEGEQIEDIVADVIHGLGSSAISVNNEPYGADKTDLVLDVFFGKRGKSSNVDEQLDVEDENRMMFPDDITLDDEVKDIVEGPLRKLSSRSWCMPGRRRDQSMFRKRSDSYILYPPNPHPELGSYTFHSDRQLGNGISQENLSRRSSAIVNTDQNQPKCQSEMIIHNNESSGGAHSKNAVHSKKPSSAGQSPVITNGRELLPPSHGNLYNHSLAPLPIPSFSDEKPEFSPPRSENTDDVSSYNGSSESLSATPSKSSNKLVVPKPQKSQSHISQGPSSRPTFTSPAIVIEQPSEISFSPLDVGYLGSDKEMSSSRYDLSTGESYNMEEPQVKHMPRSKSTELFSFKAPQNNSVDLLDFHRKADTDHNVVGISTNNGHRRQSAMSDIGTSNGIFTIEGNNTEGMMRALRKSSDISPIRSQLHESQQQNNTRRTKSYDTTGRDYFKRNIKMKDNRVKSTLRKHALSGYQSHLPADFIDECTLEALSKEDVLILWKKSEIDLESKLHEVLAKNRRLGLAIDYLTMQGVPGEPEEV